MKPTDLVQRGSSLVIPRGVSGPASTASHTVDGPIEQVLSRSASVLEHAQESVLGAAMRAEAAHGKIVLDSTRPLGPRRGQLSATVGLPVQLAEDLIAVRAGTHAAFDAIKALDSVPWRTGLPHGTHIADGAESSWDEMQSTIEALRRRSDKLAVASARLATSTPGGFHATWKDGDGIRPLSAVNRVDTMRQTLTSRGVAVENRTDREATTTLVSHLGQQPAHWMSRTAMAEAMKGRTAVSDLANDLHDVRRRMRDVEAHIKDAMTDVQGPDAARQLSARTAAHEETVRESRDHVRRLLAQ